MAAAEIVHLIGFAIILAGFVVEVAGMFGPRWFGWRRRFSMSLWSLGFLLFYLGVVVLFVSGCIR